MANVRRRLNASRMRSATAGPGSDPRTWLSLARVDDDDDAIRWEADHGWIADVTYVEGELEGEGPIPCRVGWVHLESEGGTAAPPPHGALCVVATPSGDPNIMPTIIGLVCTPDVRPPQSINGTTIDEDRAKAARLTRSTLEWDVEHDGAIRISSGDRWRVLAPNVELAEEGASQSYFRGEDGTDAINDFATAVQQAITALVPTGPPTTPVTAAQVTAALPALTAAVLQLAQGLRAALSTRIKGE